MQHEDLIEKIIGCVYRVYNKMGFGFLESVYQNCLLIELKKEGQRVEKGLTGFIIVSILLSCQRDKRVS